MLLRKEQRSNSTGLFLVQCDANCSANTCYIYIYILLDHRELWEKALQRISTDTTMMTAS